MEDHREIFTETNDPSLDKVRWILSRVETIGPLPADTKHHKVLVDRGIKITVYTIAQQECRKTRSSGAHAYRGPRIEQFAALIVIARRPMYTYTRWKRRNQ